MTREIHILCLLLRLCIGHILVQMYSSMGASFVLTFLAALPPYLVLSEWLDRWVRSHIDGAEDAR